MRPRGPRAGMIASLWLAITFVACSSKQESAPAPKPAAVCKGGTWSVLAPMNERREHPGPIRLDDGRLLVVSGHHIAGRNLSSAELFDPTTKRWTWTGSMHNPRGGGGGMLLKDGRVLVGEAFGKPNHVPSEVYSVSTGAWTISAKMNEDRQNYSMTMLPNGSVLVTGGINWNTEVTLATAEIYDPPSDKWTLTAPLGRPRFGHAAASLPDGRVLVFGGAAYPDPFNTLLTCLIYDPATGTWTSAPTMLRTYAATGVVTLANGSILVLGRGADNGRLRNPNAEATAEIYEPATGAWRAASTPLHSRIGHPLVKMRDGRILTMGGTVANVGETTTVDIYDPTTDRWTELEPAIVPRRNHGAALLPDGSVVVMGGSNAAESYLSSVELFTPCK